MAGAAVGPSTLATSACNAAAFAVGTASLLPVASTFCAQAAVAVALNFAFSIVGVFAVLALVTPKAAHEADRSAVANPGVEGGEVEGGWVQAAMRRHFPPLVLGARKG